jgi:hypothetical protein
MTKIAGRCSGVPGVAEIPGYRENTMAHINDCVPGLQARILRSGVARVVGKTGVIVEVSRKRRPPTAPLKDQVTVDVPGHGEVAVPPDDVEVQGSA